MFLHNPKTPELVSTSIPTIVTLVDLLFPTGALSKAGGKQRFDRLCLVLGESIIGSVWIHASRDVAAIRATIDQVPLLVGSLGVCAVRYLKASLLQPNHGFRSLIKVCSAIGDPTPQPPLPSTPWGTTSGVPRG